MKRTLIFGVVAVIFLGFFNIVSATETRVFLDDKRTLIVEEVVIKKEIPNVPIGISAEEALKLVKGELGKKIVTTKEEISLHFGFPAIKNTIFKNKIVTYDGKWGEVLAEPSIEKTKNYKLSIFCIILPAIGILIISFINQSKKVGHKKLLIFYVSILLSTFLGWFVGHYSGISLGIIVGGVIGAFAGMLAGLLAGICAETCTGLLAGMLAGSFVGMFAAVFVEIEQGLIYFLCIITIEVASFMIAFGAQRIRVRK